MGKRKKKQSDSKKKKAGEKQRLKEKKLLLSSEDTYFESADKNTSKKPSDKKKTDEKTENAETKTAVALLEREDSAEKADLSLEANESITETEYKTTEEKGKKLNIAGILSAVKNPLFLRISAVVGALIFVSVTLFVIILSRGVVCEAGNVPDYSHITENSFVSSLCKIDTPLSDIDTSKPALLKVKLKFFGFIKTDSRLTVTDTSNPEFTVRNVYVTKDFPLEAQTFVSSFSDNTEVTFSFENTPSVTDTGTFNVTVLGVDEGGNKAAREATLSVIDPKDTLSFEYGITTEAIKESFIALFPEIKTVDMSSAVQCGDFVLKGENENAVFFAVAKIIDTLPPKAEAFSFDILLGETVPEADFIKNTEDHSAVTTEFLSLPDYSKAGEHEVSVRLCDSFGNTAEYTCFVRIHNIKTEVTAEAGSTNDTLSALIFTDDFSKENLSFADGHVTKGMTLGKNETFLQGKYGKLSVKINIVDTIPPDFAVQPAEYPVGEIPDPSDFILSFADATNVTFSFGKTPDSSKEGTFEVTIIATDSVGNKAEHVTFVTLYLDKNPPVIRGTRDLYLIIGESCDFSAGISAYDDIWGETAVTVDSSAVNMTAAGTYPLKYTATDRCGNTAQVTVNIILRAPTRVCLDVPSLLQKPQLPNGCEVVCLTMALRYKGYSIDPATLFDNFMARSPFKAGDPWTTYVGDPRVVGGGYGCFAPCVVETGNKYLASIGEAPRVRDVSGQSLSYYESLINSGVPVLLWGTTNMSGRPKICWEADIDGKHVSWLSSSHCLLLIGYTDYTYIFCDPQKGVTEYSKSAVEISFALNFRQACIVE